MLETGAGNMGKRLDMLDSKREYTCVSSSITTPSCGLQVQLDDENSYTTMQGDGKESLAVE